MNHEQTQIWLAECLNAGGAMEAVEHDTGGGCMAVLVELDDERSALIVDAWHDPSGDTQEGLFTLFVDSADEPAETALGENLTIPQIHAMLCDLLDIAKYAHALEAVVRADMAEVPSVYAEVRSWSDLHDVCDANAFLTMVDDADPYLAHRFTAGPLGYAEPEYVRITNAAIALVERRLFADRAVA